MIEPKGLELTGVCEICGRVAGLSPCPNCSKEVCTLCRIHSHWDVPNLCKECDKKDKDGKIKMKFIR